MTLPMFKQTVSEFLSSKTNYAGMTAVVLAVVGYYSGTITMVVMVAGVLNGLGLMFIKDAVAKR